MYHVLSSRGEALMDSRENKAPPDPKRVIAGRQAAVDGFAHQHIVVGILMKRYHNVSLVDLPLSPYDLIIVRKIGEAEEIIRAQVKTATKTIKFTGGARGGADRITLRGVKEYTQSTKLSDVIIGIKPNGEKQFDLYFIPTFLVEELAQGGISIKKAEPFKNNYEFLDKCKEKEFIHQKAVELGILKG